MILDNSPTGRPTGTPRRAGRPPTPGPACADCGRRHTGFCAEGLGRLFSFVDLDGSAPLSDFGLCDGQACGARQPEVDPDSYQAGYRAGHADATAANTVRFP